MARVKRGTNVKAKHKKILKLAKGYFGRSKNCYTIALNRVNKGLQYAYAHRRDLKSDMRSLWIVRINQHVRALGMKYNEFMFKLKQKNIEINRKMLSELAIRSPLAFQNLIEQVR